jgi:hypothetical protein
MSPVVLSFVAGHPLSILAQEIIKNKDTNHDMGI